MDLTPLHSLQRITSIPPKATVLGIVLLVPPEDSQLSIEKTHTLILHHEMAFNYRAPGTTRLANGSDFVDHIHKDTYDFINPEQFNLKEWAVLITGVGLLNLTSMAMSLMYHCPGVKGHRP